MSSTNGDVCSLQDVLIPLCTDLRFDEDTLFIIFEEDYRFAPDPGDAAWTHKKRLDTFYTLSSSSEPSPPPAVPGSSSSSSAAPSTQNKIPRGHKETIARQKSASQRVMIENEHYRVLNRPPAKDWRNTSIFLRDLVAYATLAHRQKRGDFIFCGWQPHRADESETCKNKDNFRSGTMLTMVSKNGFWKLQDKWEVHAKLKTPGHIDQCLKGFFSDQTINWSSYITPPLGGYFSHISGCDPAQGLRPSIWMEDFACPGTRQSHDWNDPPRKKHLCCFTTNGRVSWLREINVEVPDDQVKWLTSDERTELGPAKESGGWGCVQWDPDIMNFSERSERQLREGRRLRLREKFRHYVDPDPTPHSPQAFPAL